MSFADFGLQKDVSMKWIEINNRFANPQVRHVEKLQRRKKVCFSELRILDP